MRAAIERGTGNRSLRGFQGTLVLVVAGALAGCGDEPESFLMQSAQRGPIEATVSATGTLNPVHMVEVGTYASGRIESVEVDYNSAVTEGQLVAKIDPANALVRVQKARANVLSCMHEPQNMPAPPAVTIATCMMRIVN